MGDPAAMPVLPQNSLRTNWNHVSKSAHLNVSKLNSSPEALRLSASAKIPKKCVGTPCSAVHFSSVTVSTTAAGSKVGEGYTMQAPWVHVAKFPRTRRVHEKRDYQSIGQHDRRKCCTHQNSGRVEACYLKKKSSGQILRNPSRRTYIRYLALKTTYFDRYWVHC